MSKAQLKEELALPANYTEGNYLIVALPIHDDGGSVPVVNENGVTVGNPNEWRRIPWSDILGTHS